MENNLKAQRMLCSCALLEQSTEVSLIQPRDGWEKYSKQTISECFMYLTIELGIKQYVCMYDVL